MSDPAGPSGKEASPPRYVRMVCGAAIVSLVFVFLPFLSGDTMEDLRSAGLIVLPFLVTLFVVILWRLRRPPYKDGLALAVAVGASVALLSITLAAFISLREPSSTWFLVLFAITQAIQAGTALAAYSRIGYASTDWTVVPMAIAGPLPDEVTARVRNRIRLIRYAAAGSMVLFCAIVPPWRWLAEPLAPFLIVLLLLPLLLILWRLRKTPRKNGLALALGTGGLLFLAAASVLFGLWGSNFVVWQALFWLALFTVVQGVLAASAIVAFAGIGYVKGDWKLLVRGVVDPLVYYAVVGILSAAALRLAF